MNIFDFFFSIFKDLLSVYNVDFFGFGFTFLQFILGGLLIIFIVKFFIRSFFAADHDNFFSLIPALKRTNSISNKKREQQIASHSYPSSDFVDVLGDGTYLVPKSEYFRED